jgi:hypothetical protein
MKQRTQPLDLHDFFEKFSFQTLAQDFSDKENNMYLQNHLHYASPQKKSVPRLSDLINKIWD